jgi:hypothetical protein
MRRSITALGVLLALCIPQLLPAQRLITLGLGGGVSVPQGDLSNAANVGWNALGSLILSTPMQPLGLRADVAYNQFPFSAATQSLLGTGNQRVGSLTANVMYRLPTPGTPISPHLIAGLGAYRTDCSVSASCEAVTHFGWNVGLGMKLYVLGFRSFLEARYHRTSANGSSINYFPVTLGLII